MALLSVLPQAACEEKALPPDQARERMVREQIAGRGVRDPRVLDAMRKVPRHLFVPPEWAHRAYDDGPLSIGFDQTISQPYIVGFMTEQLRPKPEHVALEIGTGSGYQAAVLSLLVAKVYTIEIVPELARQSADRLKKLGYQNVEVRHGDGYAGWPQHAPFDLIVVTAAPEQIPQALVEQLKIAGRMVIPTGRRDNQHLRIVEKNERYETKVRTVFPVAFVPMVKGSSQ